jgi:catalase
MRKKSAKQKPPAQQKTPAARPLPTNRPGASGTEADKPRDLLVNKEGGLGQPLTTNQGTAIHDNQNTLKAEPRGPSLLEDFIFRDKSRISTTKESLSGSSTR